MRVVLLILDSMPHRMISPEATPHLWRQIEAGGWAPTGGESLPISVTYSNHAAFVTGRSDVETGLWGNRAWTGEKFIHTATAGPRAETIFERCAAAGKRSVCAVGDHKIVTTIGAQHADETWPPTADVPEGTPVDAYGYPTDAAVIAAVDTMDLDADLVVLHLNEPDTTLHVHGPESPEAAAQITASDAAFGELIERLQPRWDDTVLLAISDHEQEQITAPECVNLRALVEAQDWNATVSDEGTGAVIIGDVTADAVAELDGVEGASNAAPGVVYAWTAPGHMFGRGPVPTLGNHGSPRCRTQMAIVSGGHPVVGELARRIEQERPSSLTWAPLITELLELEESP